MKDKDFKWINCIESLKGYVAHYKTIGSKNALEWVCEAVAKYPDHPPTMIIPYEEGMVVEITNGDYCCELIFKDDNSVERTDYIKNKAVEVCWI